MAEYDIGKIRELSPLGIRYWLLPKKKDPMKKAIMKVQKEIEAKEERLKIASSDEEQFRDAAYNAYADGVQLRGEIKRLRECRDTLKRFFVGEN